MMVMKNIMMNMNMMKNPCKSVKSKLLFTNNVMLINVMIINNMIMVDVMIVNIVKNGTMKMIMGGVFESEMHIAQVYQWNT